MITCKSYCINLFPFATTLKYMPPVLIGCKPTLGQVMNGLGPEGNEPLAEPMLTQIYDIITGPQ